MPYSAVGESCIGRGGIARGYHNRPELTRERFTTQLIDKQEIRLYKSGDRTRMTPDGELEYLGLADHQVQLQECRQCRNNLNIG